MIEVEEEPSLPRADVEDSRIGEELSKVAAHVSRPGTFGRAEVDQKEADAILGWHSRSPEVA